MLIKKATLVGQHQAVSERKIRVTPPLQPPLPVASSVTARIRVTKLAPLRRGLPKPVRHELAGHNPFRASGSASLNLR